MNHRYLGEINMERVQTTNKLKGKKSAQMYDQRFLATIGDEALKKWYSTLVAVSKSGDIMFDTQSQIKEDLEKEMKSRNISFDKKETGSGSA